MKVGVGLAWRVYPNFQFQLTAIETGIRIGIGVEMGKSTAFKDTYSFDERCQESQDIIARYPDRLPVVVERYTKTDLPEMEKKKYLVPRDMSIGQFIHILSGRLHLAPGKALFVFVQNTLPQTSNLIESVYESFKDEDGFLYMCYSSEKTFGNMNE
ncbi:hypothetical protein R6Q57_017346 [Mikania cordata]